MKSAHVAVIGLLAMAVMIPMAKAQTSTFTLVQTAKPIAPSYPGVNANILGLRIGMTLSQAKAIAAKRLPGSKSQEFKRAVSTDYRGGSVSSQSYVSRVDVRYGPSDLLRLYFTNPATGNVLYGMELTIFYPDVSKAPLMTAQKAALIKQYGPPSVHNRGTWQFGEHKLKPCPALGCVNLGVAVPGMYKRALQLGVVLEIDATLAASRTDNTKLGWISAAMEDYQVKNESVNAADKQLKTLATAYYNKMAAAKAKAEKKLTKNANNVLDVTGTVTGHALVVGCIINDVSGHTLARTFSNAEAVKEPMFVPKYISEALFRKYELGPVTYDGKKYNMKVRAFGRPPDATNAGVELDPLKGPGVILSGNTLVSGSITVAAFGQSVAYTFDHAVLKLEGTGVPPNATVTINGKAYCVRGGNAPVPPDLIVPTQTLTGTYAWINSQRLAILYDFVSATAVDVQFPSQNLKEQGTYHFDGHILQLVSPNGESGFLKADSNGCFVATNNAKFCKSTAQKLAAAKAMKAKQAQEAKAREAKQAQEKAAAAAAEKKKALKKLMPKF